MFHLKYIGHKYMCYLLSQYVACTKELFILLDVKLTIDETVVIGWKMIHFE